MLLRQHAGGQKRGSVAGQHRYDHLPQYRPVVQFGRDFVDCGTREPATRIDGALVRVQTGERG